MHPGQDKFSSSSSGFHRKIWLESFAQSFISLESLHFLWITSGSLKCIKTFLPNINCFNGGNNTKLKIGKVSNGEFISMVHPIEFQSTWSFLGLH